jgi:hypothetical protein
MLDAKVDYQMAQTHADRIKSTSSCDRIPTITRRGASPGRSTSLHWKFLREDEPWDAEWGNETSVGASAAVPSDTYAKRVDRNVVLFTLLALCGLIYVWSTSQRAAQRQEANLHAAVIADQMQTALPGNNSDRLAEVSMEVTAVPAADLAAVAVQSVSMDGEIAEVRIQTRYTLAGGQTQVMQQRVFYQETGAGWQRVPMHGAHLGPVYVHETEYFSILYHALDEASVAAIAPEIDAIYSELRRDYGLPLDGNRVVVEVFHAEVLHESGCARRHRLCIHSPALTELPVELSEVDALRLWLLNRLVYRVRGEALLVEAFHDTWQSIGLSLTRFHLRSYNARLAAWHTDLVRWFNGPNARPFGLDAEAMTREIAELCTKHRIAALYPHISDITGTNLCIVAPSFDLQHLEDYWEDYRLLNRLAQVVEYDVSNEVSNEPGVTWRELLVIETWLDYVVATYGREALPALVDGFRRYGDWETLTPAVFGVTAEEFEEGWHAYLAKEYGVKR